MTHPLDQAIDGVRRAARRIAIGYGLGVCLGALLAGLLLVGMLDFYLRTELVPLRLLLSLSVASFALWAAYRFLLPALRGRLSDVELAQRLQDRFPVLGDRLASAMEFIHEPEEAPTAGSAMLRRAVIVDAMVETKKLDLGEVLDRQPMRRALLGAGVAALMVAAAMLLWPDRSWIAARRLANPFGSTQWPRSNDLKFRVEKKRLAAGQIFEVELVDLRGNLPDDVQIQYRFGGGDGRTISEPMRRLGESMTASRENVQRAFSYRAVGGDDHTMPWIDLAVVEPARLEALRVSIDPPEYTGWPQETSTGAIAALVGTRLTMAGKSSKPLSAVAMKHENGNSVAGQVAEDGRSFVVPAPGAEPLLVKDSGSYWFELTDREEVIGGTDQRHYLRAVPDEPPSVALEKPTADLYLTAAATAPFSVLAKDRLALKSVDLLYTRSDKSEEKDRRIPLYSGPEKFPRTEKTGLAVATDEGDRRALNYELKLADLKLPAGAQLAVHATATDYQPAVGQSPAVRIFIITPRELEERVAKQQAQVLGDLARALKLEREARARVKGLEIQMQQVGRLSKGDLDQLQAAELQQRDVRRMLGGSTEAARSQINGVLEQLKNNQLSSPEIERRMNGLSAVLDALEQQQLPGAERDLNSALKNAQIDQERRGGADSNKADPNRADSNSADGNSANRTAPKSSAPAKPAPAKGSGDKAPDAPPAPGDQPPHSADPPQADSPADGQARDGQSQDPTPAGANRPGRGQKSSPPPAGRPQAGQPQAGEPQNGQPEPGQPQADQPQAPEATPQQGNQRNQDETGRSLEAAGQQQEQVAEALDKAISDLKRWDKYREYSRDLAGIEQRQRQEREQTAGLLSKTLGRELKELSPQQGADLKKQAERQAELARELNKLVAGMEKTRRELEQTDPLAAQSLDDAMAQARQSAVAQKMASAAAKVDQNQVADALRQQAEAGEDLQEMLDVLSSRREQELSRLVKKLREAEQKLADLHQQQSALRKKMKEAAQKTDPQERKREMQRLAHEQEQMQQEAQRLARQLKRLEASRAAAKLAGAASRMSKAGQQGQQGAEQQADDEAAAAEKDLEQAEQQLAQERQQAEIDLVQEQLVRLKDQLQGLQQQQQTLLDETKRLEGLRVVQQELTRGQEVSVSNLARNQAGLAGDVGQAARKLAAAEGFGLALTRASADMQRAATSLARLNTGTQPQDAQRRALGRLAMVLDALKQDKPESDMEDPGGEGGQQGQENKQAQQPQQAGDGIHTLQELKLLKLMQQDVRERTDALDAQKRSAGKLTDDEVRQLAELADEQGRLADLMLKLHEPAPAAPEDDPDKLPGANKPDEARPDDGEEK